MKKHEELLAYDEATPSVMEALKQERMAHVGRLMADMGLTGTIRYQGEVLRFCYIAWDDLRGTMIAYRTKNDIAREFALEAVITAYARGDAEALGDVFFPSAW